jgi:hypothetical protein
MPKACAADYRSGVAMSVSKAFLVKELTLTCLNNRVRNPYEQIRGAHLDGLTNIGHLLHQIVFIP